MSAIMRGFDLFLLPFFLLLFFHFGHSSPHLKAAISFYECHLFRKI